jgi:hypothetical protein
MYVVFVDYSPIVVLLLRRQNMVILSVSVSILALKLDAGADLHFHPIGGEPELPTFF